MSSSLYLVMMALSPAAEKKLSNEWVIILHVECMQASRLWICIQRPKSLMALNVVIGITIEDEVMFRLMFTPHPAFYASRAGLLSDVWRHKSWRASWANGFHIEPCSNLLTWLATTGMCSFFHPEKGGQVCIDRLHWLWRSCMVSMQSWSCQTCSMYMLNGFGYGHAGSAGLSTLLPNGMWKARNPCHIQFTYHAIATCTEFLSRL